MKPFKPLSPPEWDETTKQNLNEWLSGNYDEETKACIRLIMKEKPSEIINSFYKKLSFGTAGMRGIMGVGSNRMNQYTVGAATQALANYLLQQPLPNNRPHSVFIGYDCREHSQEFAEEAARVLAGNHIHVFLCRHLRPTPLISFGCRYKKCSAAIMITASHNPRQYNGYKVYWNDGGQVLPPHDTGILAQLNSITDPSQVKRDLSLPNPHVQMCESEIDAAYLKAISTQQLYPVEGQQKGKQLKIIYTNLHGTGITLMPQTLTAWGFPHVQFVASQKEPDGTFPTVDAPNPEEESALRLGIQALENENADLLIATDPDGDRLGVAFRHHGATLILNGNQIASLLTHHICAGLTKQGRLPKNAAFVKTIVTTDLMSAITTAYKCPCINVLTGFKHIAAQIRHWEQEPNSPLFIFGAEESYGYLSGTQTRDKDAILSGALLCEIALLAKLEKKTLLDQLHFLYATYGTFVEKVLSVNFEDSKNGKDQMTAAMDKLHHSPIKAIGKIPVQKVDDYLRSLSTTYPNKNTTPLTLPQSDLIVFWLENGSKIIIRPSGTEPKIKIYCSIQLHKTADIPLALLQGNQQTDMLLQEVKQMLMSFYTYSRDQSFTRDIITAR